MSTLKRFRNPSGVQYIDTMKELVAHTVFYINRMPKSTRFIWQTKICDLAQSALINVARANAIRIVDDETFNLRRRLLLLSLGNIDALEIFVSTIAIGGYYKDISKDGDYAFLHWGELMDKERNLIKKVMEKDGGTRSLDNGKRAENSPNSGGTSYVCFVNTNGLANNNNANNNNRVAP